MHTTAAFTPRIMRRLGSGVDVTSTVEDHCVPVDLPRAGRPLVLSRREDACMRHTFWKPRLATLERSR